MHCGLLKLLINFPSTDEADVKKNFVGRTVPRSSFSRPFFFTVLAPFLGLSTLIKLYALSVRRELLTFGDSIALGSDNCFVGECFLTFRRISFSSSSEINQSTSWAGVPWKIKQSSETSGAVHPMTQGRILAASL
jgi:hypothetical protein